MDNGQLKTDKIQNEIIEEFSVFDEWLDKYEYLISLSDTDIAALCKESVDWMDANNPVAGDDSPYTVRLKKLTAGITDVNGLPLNFKVYLVTDVNAFACPGGYIFVQTGLILSMQQESELAGVMAHEIAHVTQRHIAKRMEIIGEVPCAVLHVNDMDAQVGCCEGASPAVLAHGCICCR